MPTESPAEDDRIVARLVAREEGAWEDLLRRHRGMIEASCRRALRQAGQPSDAAAVADAAGEVLRALLEEDCRLLRRFRSGASLGTYLHVIARNRTLNLARRRTPGGIPWLGEPASAEDPAALAQAAERQGRLAEALCSLPEREAGLLTLYYLEGLCYHEVAERTGLPETQVGVLLLRAREALRQKLGREFGDFL